jgi:hypothetical protein
VGPRTGLDDVEKILDATGTRTPTSRFSSPYLVLLSSLVGCVNRHSEECFHRVVQGAVGMGLSNQGGGGPKWEPLS